MDDVTSRLVGFCRSLRYEDLPEPAIDAAKVEILDGLGIGLAGRNADGIAELLAVASEWGGTPQCSIIGHTERLPSPSAAFVNGAIIHALDYDGGHTGAFVHTAPVTVATAFSAAERIGRVSGREMLTAVALGADVFSRLGLGLKTNTNKARSGWHWTAVLGYLAAAMTAGRIFGLDEGKLRNALGIAYHQCAGNTQGVADGALTKRLGPGLAARGGILAALLAERGITGAADIFNGEYSLSRLYGRTDRYDSATCLAGLGTVFHGASVDVKFYPCGGMMFPFIDACLELMTASRFAVSDIERIVVRHGEGSRGFVEPLEARRKPRNAVDTQFSIPWVVAVALAKGRVSLEFFTQEAIRDSEILAVSSRITPRLDRQLNQATGLEPGAVDLYMKDGSVLSCTRRNYMAGDSGVPAYDRVSEKFMNCADFSRAMIPRPRLEEVASSIHELERLDDATEVLRMLVPSG